MNTKNILIIDDEENITSMLRRLFERKGYTVFTACDGLEGIRAFKNNHIDLVITDIIMPEKEGVEVIFELQRSNSNCKIIAVSGGGYLNPQDYLSTAEEIGVSATFSKPFDTQELLAKVQELIG